MRKQNKTKAHLKRRVTREELLRLLKYDKNTGYFYWKIPRGSMIKAGDLAGTDTGNGIIRINVNGRRYYRSHLVWFLETNQWPEEGIAYLDRDKSNDAIYNLCESSVIEHWWHDKIKIEDEPDGLLLNSEYKLVVVFEGTCFGVFKNHSTAQEIYKALNKLKGILDGRK